MKFDCLLLVVGLFAASYGVENEGARFLVLPRTVVSTVTNTATAVATRLITKSCATSAGPLTVCRKRRSVTEQPDILSADDTEEDDDINPTKPIGIEITDSDVQIEIHDKRGNRAVVSVTEPPNNQTEKPVEVESSIESVAGMAEVQINNLDAICKSRGASPFFGVGLAQLVSITVLYSSTTTVTVTTTNFVTSVATTNKFTIAGCLPSPLSFDLC